MNSVKRYGRTSGKQPPKMQRLGGCLQELDHKGEIVQVT